MSMRPVSPSMPAAATITLAVVLSLASCSSETGGGAASKEVFERLDCAERDLRSLTGEERNEIFACAVKARIQDINDQSDQYPTLTDQVMNACLTDQRSGPGKGEEVARCLLDQGL
jgi:hypothetical protein